MNYRMSYVLWGLFYTETVAIVKIFLEESNWVNTREWVLSENRLNANMKRSGNRVYREIELRLKTLTPEQLNLLENGTAEEQRQLIWLGCCKRYRFLCELATELLTEKLMTREILITTADYEAFYTLFFFEKLFKAALSDDPCTQDLLVFANTWKDSVSNRKSYVYFADEISDYLFDNWEFDALPAQTTFYDRYVVEESGRRKKVAVIISDALRYEVGHELKTRIQSENRYSATLEALYASLPSYTSLGMASLLPHDNLEWQSNNGGIPTVLVDGVPSGGMENREKILQARNEQSLCLKSETMRAQTPSQLRETTRSAEVVYCYHNVIDEVGDKRLSEGKTFEACETAICEIVELIKKFANANFNTFIVTADHGFLFTQGDVEISDFTGAAVNGDEVLLEKPRFVIGRGLKKDPGFMHFDAKQLGIQGELEVLIPKSINRIRRRGSGQRFVHGGASLQEIIIPVLTVNKKRTDDVESVAVSILTNSSTVISTGTLSIRLYQETPCSEKIHPIQLKIGLYTKKGILVSDTVDLLFDSKSETPKDREHLVDLRLTTEASRYNNKKLYLKLTQPYGNTGKYMTYKEKAYQLRMTFGLDF